MKAYKVALFVTMLFLLSLAGCKNHQEPVQPTPTPPVQEVTSTPTPTALPSFPTTMATPLPAPTPSEGEVTSTPVLTPAPVAAATPTPTPAETPIDYDEIFRQEGITATVEGFCHRPFEELPEELRNSLVWDGEVRTVEGYHFRLRDYTAPGIVVTTTEAPEETLQEWFDFQLSLPEDDQSREGTDEELLAEYQLELGREWLYSVTITDDSYTTLLGLKVGNTVEEAEALGYPLRQRLTADGEATFGNTWEHSLRVYVEDDVVKELYLYWGIGRYTGKYWDL